MIRIEELWNLKTEDSLQGEKEDENNKVEVCVDVS